MEAACSAASTLAVEDFLGTLYPTMGFTGLSGDTCLRPSGSGKCTKKKKVITYVIA